MQMDHEVDILLGYLDRRRRDQTAVCMDLDALDMHRLRRDFQARDALVFRRLNFRPQLDHGKATDGARRQLKISGHDGAPS
jgi:hypothetical protein